ncbi:hypothetical protein AYX14_07088 [Cryptococcus neoformans]|nr:hypothetical protein AYX15_07065 [Cryptococcus neoformans var. grubii]OWZ60697.1 hypothetical protein AYX14_07088 [Cryptococcus neoformans var. grubii]
MNGIHYVKPRSNSASRELENGINQFNLP